jgi:dipeptidyl-peptidase 4
MKRYLPLCQILCCLLLFSSLSIQAQNKKELTLDDIFRSNTFSSRSVFGINWMKDGQFYSSQVSIPQRAAEFVVKFDVRTGQAVDTLVRGNELIPEGENANIRFSSYSFSADESKVLLSSQVESIYRRSSKAFFFIYDLKIKKLSRLAQGAKQQYATFSPDGSKVAFVRDNDLYMVDLADMKETRITSDGKYNHIINGGADWVYEEEFSMAKAFHWSPDSKKIAFWRFDESDVKVFNMQMWGPLYPQDYLFKYPKAGEDNAKIQIKVFHVDKGNTVGMDIGMEDDIYIPRLYWTGNADILSIIRMNRLQNQLEILHANVANGDSKVILTETSETYVDLNFTDDLMYLADGKTFIRTSEKDGFKHIYHHNVDGSLIRQITIGKFEVSNFIGVDEKNKLAYFISTEVSPLERHLYSINLDGKNKKRMTQASGMHRANFSLDFKYYINYFSSPSEPGIVSLHEAPSGKQLKVLEDNSALKQRISEFAMGQKEFFSFKIEDGTELNGYMIKPDDFDPNKEYPVFMYVYGGPGSQNVSLNWGGTRDLWFRMLAAKGYIVACIDNRGTGARGRDFQHLTYGILGKYEVEDQIAGAKYLGSLPYVDANRIGIWGWSYGGYMSSLALFIGNDVFKMAIAVAPVTNWRYYDSIYTERYMKTPQLNGDGYDAYSPNTHISKLKGDLLLIHGTGDDNVHFQNAVSMVDKLVAANKQFESFYYPNRNHGISGGMTTIHLYTMMTDFILRKL